LGTTIGLTRRTRRTGLRLFSFRCSGDTERRSRYNLLPFFRLTSSVRLWLSPIPIEAANRKRGATSTESGERTTRRLFGLGQIDCPHVSAAAALEYNFEPSSFRYFVCGICTSKVVVGLVVRTHTNRTNDADRRFKSRCSHQPTHTHTKREFKLRRPPQGAHTIYPSQRPDRMTKRRQRKWKTNARFLTTCML
jgi:hypothetical protein